MHERQQLFASDATTFQRFGIDVAISGERLVVGAPRDNNENGFVSGAVYVFDRVPAGAGGSMWVESAKIIAPNGQADMEFGTAVALDGDVLVVGAPTNDFHANGIGSVWEFVYDDEAQTWAHTQFIPDPEFDADERFGRELDLSGDRLAVSAVLDGEAGVAAGAVFILERDGDGAWAPADKITPTDPDPGFGVFGDAIDLKGDELMIGAPSYSGVLSNAGLAQTWIYAPDGAGTTAWFISRRYLPGDPQPAQLYGSGVHLLDGGRALIGAQGDGEVDIRSGALYLYDPLAPIGLDCNANGTCDAHDIQFGESADCNLNGVPDECDLSGGASSDCNGNGVPDECEIDEGSADDCDGNGIPDACDIAGGAQDDCNLNGVPDACEVERQLELTGDRISPFHVSSPAIYIIANPQPTTSDVTLTVTAGGDLNESFEFVSLLINDTPVTTLFVDTVSLDCLIAGTTEVVTLDAETFNGFITGAPMEFVLAPNGAVGAQACGGASFAELAVSYGIIPVNDVNRNDVPDDCELVGDLDGDGTIGFGDLQAMLAQWGPCPVDPPCLGDLDGDGTVTFNDLLILLAAWGETA